MSARVDAVKGEVAAGQGRWRFVLDSRDGSVVVELGGGRVRLRSHSWRAKRVLARFAHLGDAFVADQLVRACLDEESALPEDGAEREALLALARWLNAPGGEPPLPLDARVLAAVNLHVCRATHTAPTALDDLDAADVELMWRAAHAEADAPPPEPSDTTRILIVPDGRATASPRLDGEERERRATRIPSRPAPAPAAASPSGRESDGALASPPVSGSASPSGDDGERRGGGEARDGSERAEPTSRASLSPARRALSPAARFRVTLGPLAPSAPAATVAAPASVSGRDASSAPAPVLVTSSEPAAPPPWPWPVSGTSRAGAWAPARGALAARDADGDGVRAVVTPAPSAEAETDRSTLVGPGRAARSPGVADDIFDELAIRLEQAADELGIDVGP